MEEEQLPRVSVHEVFGIIAMAVERKERTEVTGILNYRGMGRQFLSLGSGLLRPNKNSIAGLKLRTLNTMKSQSGSVWDISCGSLFPRVVRCVCKGFPRIQFQLAQHENVYELTSYRSNRSIKASPIMI